MIHFFRAAAAGLAAALLWTCPISAAELQMVQTKETVSAYAAPSLSAPVLERFTAGEQFGFQTQIYTDTHTLSDVYRLYQLPDLWYVTDVDGLAAYVPAVSCKLLTSTGASGVPVVMGSGVIAVSNPVREGALERCLAYYTMVPENIRTRFEAEGFQIRCTSSCAEEAYAPYGGYTGVGEVRGVFDYELKRLYVSDTEPSAVVHEIGHYVNDRLDMYSARHRDVYESEAAKVSVYGTSNDREFFGEVFSLYVREPGLLMQLSPASYAYVEQALAEFAALPPV